MRLFTFGCSNTGYHYPTWADIVGKNFDQFQNWGRPGAGNNYIFNAVNRCHLKEHLTQNDTVLILWSGIARIDYYQINEWCHLVNQYFDLHNSHMPYSCPQGYQWLSFAWMAATQYMLEHLGVNYKMFAWQQFDSDTEAYDLYRPVLEKIHHAPLFTNQKPYLLHPQSKKTAQELYNRIAGASWPPLDCIVDGTYKNLDINDYIRQELDDFCVMMEKDKRFSSKVYNQLDHHPSPAQHLLWVETYLPQYPVSQTIRDWIADIDSKLAKNHSYDFEFKNF